MPHKLHVLLVEDSPTDAKLVVRELQRDGREIVWNRVEDAAAMQAALSSRWDVVISDWSLPKFSALDAMAILQQSGLDIPLIIVSGTVGEDTAVEAMRRGARDYVLKDRLARLAPAVERELRERDLRAAHHRAEAALRGTEARFRRVLEASNEGVWTLDAGLNTSFMNRRMAEMLGCRAHDAVGVPMQDFIAADSHPMLRDGFERCRVGLPAHCETTLRRRNGTSFWAVVYATPITLDTGAFGGVLVMATDISDRKRTEDALLASQARFARLAESGIIGISVADISGHLYEVNDAYMGMLGYSREELLGGTLGWRELTPPEWHASDARAVEQLLSTGVAKPWEKELFRKNGSRLPILVGVAMLDHPRCISFQVDLSERRHAEEALRKSELRLRQAQKMEAIGNVAGGIAHDFNNLLSVILSYSTLIRADLDPADPVSADVDQIRIAGERAADLTRQLLAFSRQQVMQPRLLNLNEVVARMEKLLRRVIGEDIQLVTIASPEPPLARIDPGQLEQVLMNLAVNSRDAMPQGGRLTIEASVVTLDAAYAAEHIGAQPGSHVRLAVSDTGIGMDAATQARMFEPFFTTKEKGKGTGLGLSTVFGIVKQSGGSIWVYSEPGKGTTFKIYFPRVSEGSAEELAPAQHLTDVPRGSETILLVEDDDHVRAIASTILRRLGYLVLEAREGGEALLICEQHPASIHLLLTDVVMPRMGGRQLSERLLKLRPQMKVLYMSGYTDNSIVHHGVLDSDVNFIQKPFTPESLGRKVREVLGTAIGQRNS